MAKKRRKEEQEEKYEFVPPDFDEKTFLEKDMTGTKALFASSLMGLILGIVAFAVTGYSPYLGIIAIFGGALTLRFVYPLFRIEFASIEKKTLIGNYVLLVFLALGIWIILLNPPFSDLDSPQVMHQKTFFDQDGTVTLYKGDSTPITAGDLTNITVDARDNGKIASVQIEVHVSSAGSGSFTDMQSTGNYGRYEFKASYPTVGGSLTQYIYTIKLTDGAGHVTTTQGSFTIVP